MTREEAIHILEYERDNDIFCSSYRQKVHVAMDMGIEALKGRPKGEWKVRLPKPFLLCECSICGESEEWMSKFCPNCGADMGDENE